MSAILFGLAAASFWAVTTLASARASRSIGAASTLGLVMALGLLIAVPAVLLSGPLPELGRDAIAWLALAGIGNVTGLFLQYRGVQTGQVGVVAAISSTEGAITAVIAIALGEPVAAGVAAALAVIVVGVVFAAGGGAAAAAGEGIADGDTEPVTGRADPVLVSGTHVPDGGERGLAGGGPGVSRRGSQPADARTAALFGVGAAVGFGIGLYAAGRVGTDLSVAWAILPARLVGTAVIALPLALRGRLRSDRSAIPAVVVVALAEVGGIVAFALGARSSIAVTAVLGSQFGVIAALAAYVVFHERLARRQWIGVATTAVGVAALGALRV